MAGDDKPGYLRAAFANVYNLSLLVGGLTAAVMTGDWFIGAATVGLEAAWLLMGPELRPFKRAVDQDARQRREKTERERVLKLMESLPERDWQRAKAIDDLKKEIERDVQANPSFQAMLLQPELDKLAQLQSHFITLATACARAQAYLGSTDVRDLQRQVEIQEGMQEKFQDAQAAELARKNAAVLKKRIDSMQEIQTFLTRARGQMNLIENSVRLLRDQVLTMASPDQLGEQLSDLLVSVEAVQASARENDALLQQASTLEPVAPIGAGGEAARQPPDRVRS